MSSIQIILSMNTKPYFGGKIRGVGTDMNVSENILDNKTGLDLKVYVNKNKHHYLNQ